MFIDPAIPWQNAWIESLDSRMRDELLNLSVFDSLLEARVIIDDWRIDQVRNRPHTAHGDLTPTEFANHWTTINQPQTAWHLDQSSEPAQGRDRSDDPIRVTGAWR